MEKNAIIGDDNTSSSTSKKRNRKRRNNTADEIKTENVSENTSRSGRRRKQINYYELANPGGLDFVKIDNTKKPTTPVTVVEKRQYSKKSKLNKTVKNNNETDKSDLEQSECSNSQIIEIKNDLDDNNSDKNTKNDQKLNENNDDCGKTGINDEKSTQNSRKYSTTGETIKMMNTLFTIYRNDNTGDKVDETKTTTENSKKTRRKLSPDNSTITCAVCNNSMDKTLWSHHKQRYHNNLAWRIGEPSLDLSDQALVMRTLNVLYKKKKPLYCDKCGEVKKSVVGFLSHQSQCKKSGEEMESVKIECDLCGRRMLPVSLITHMKFMHAKKNEETIDDTTTTTTTNTSQSVSPSKRSAAKKALKIIENFAKDDSTEEKWFTRNLDFRNQDFALTILKNEFECSQKIECKFNCKCVFDSLDDALTHFDTCYEKPNEGFACKECLMVSPKLEEIIYHIEMTHDIQITVKSEDNNCDKSYNARLPHFLATMPKRNNFSIFPLSFEWTNKFHQENFSDLLFDDLHCNPSDWLLLPFNNVIEYLPKLNESCETAHKITSIINPNLINESYQFKKYELFEYEHDDDGGKYTIFCGGPITSLSWLPIPTNRNDEHQILAVSIINQPDEKYLLNENYQLSTAIQFWDFGILKNRQKPIIIPTLIFSLVHNHGPVWHMEWCPSGCFNNKTEKFGRMGLLSVTGSDAIVYIYSIPHCYENNEGLYFKPKPVLKLLLQKPGSPLLGGMKYYPRKTSWSKGLGHSFIAVGYTNGFVGIFNLKTNSPILKQKDCDGVFYLLPSKVFQPHSHSITALTLHPLSGGARWLLTGSLDRNLCLWDLENPIYPISQSKKNVITDSFWFNNWLSSVAAVDEGSTQAYVSSSLKQVRDFMSEPTASLLFSQATITTVDGSDWLNAAVQGNVVGEIEGMLFNQLCVNPLSNRSYKRKRLLFGYTYLLEKSKTPQERYKDYETRRTALQESSSNRSYSGIKISPNSLNDNELIINEPLLYEDAVDKYALLFCDNKMESTADFPEAQSSQLTANSKSFATSLPNQYPLNAITKIVFNPNRQASLYYAAGYQAGFVRISWLSFLRNDSEIR